MDGPGHGHPEPEHPEGRGSGPDQRLYASALLAVESCRAVRQVPLQDGYAARHLKSHQQRHHAAGPEAAAGEAEGPRVLHPPGGQVAPRLLQLGHDPDLPRVRYLLRDLPGPRYCGE